MNGRLYRLTPAGGKPNHYTDSYASALGRLNTDYDKRSLWRLQVGQRFTATDASGSRPGINMDCEGTTVERVA